MNKISFILILFLNSYYVFSFQINIKKVLSFSNNKEIISILNYKSLSNEKYIILGGLDKFINITLENEDFNIKIYYPFKNIFIDSKKELCLKIYKNCNNYIRVVIPIKDYYIICSTRGYNPICFNYNSTDLNIIDGKGKSPIDPYDNSYIYLKLNNTENIFFATSSAKAIITYNNFKTTYNAFKINPKFIYAFEYKNKIYFLLNELHTDLNENKWLINTGKIVTINNNFTKNTDKKLLNITKKKQ